MCQTTCSFSHVAAATSLALNILAILQAHESAVLRHDVRTTTLTHSWYLFSFLRLNKMCHSLQSASEAELETQAPLSPPIKKPFYIGRLITCCRLQLLRSSISSFGSWARRLPSKCLTAACWQTSGCWNPCCRTKGEACGQVSLVTPQPDLSQKLLKAPQLPLMCMHAGGIRRKL